MMKFLFVLLLSCSAFAHSTPSAPLDVCSTCKAIVGVIENWLEENKTIAQIEAELEKLCKLLGGNLEQTCDALVEVGVPTIVNWLEQNEPPEVVCKNLKFCPQQRIAPRQTLCAVCQLVVTAVDNWLEQNATVETIEQRLEQLCALLGKTAEPLCDMIVEAGVPMLIKWIEANEDPHSVCYDQLKVCTLRRRAPEMVAKVLKAQLRERLVPRRHMRPVPVPQRPLRLAPNQDLCSICKLLVSTIDMWLKENATVQQIEQRLESICNLLGKTVAPMCDALVEAGVPEVINWIETHEDPHTVCYVQLKFCSNSSLLQAPPQQTLCTICQLLVTAIESWLAENATVNTIEQRLEQLCALLGKSVEPICDALVEAGVPQIIQWIETHEDAHEVCFVQLKFCTLAMPTRKMMLQH